MRTVWSGACAALAVLLAACGGAARAAESGSPTASTVPPTTAAVVPGELVSACVQYVPTAAFLGRADAAVYWERAGQDRARLVQVCEEIGRADLGPLVRMERELAELEAFLDVASRG